MRNVHLKGCDNEDEIELHTQGLSSPPRVPHSQSHASLALHLLMESWSSLCRAKSYTGWLTTFVVPKFVSLYPTIKLNIYKVHTLQVYKCVGLIKIIINLHPMDYNFLN